MRHFENNGILFVGHEATRTGAPIALLHFLRWFRANVSRPFSILLAAGGDLVGEFQELGDTFPIDRSHFHRLALPSRILRNAHLSSVSRRAQAAEIKRFAARASPSLVYVNSIASAAAVSLLAPRVPILTHVHELAFSYGAIDPVDWRPLLAATAQFIAGSNAVRENLVHGHGIAAGRVETVHESIPISQIQARRTRGDVMRELGFPADALLVIGAGSICWRKGVDLFVQMVRAVCRRKPAVPVYFAWVGAGERLDTAEFEHDIRGSGLTERIRLPGSVPDGTDPSQDCPNLADYLAAADVFVLPSREDPYPLVCLEAAALGKPIVCFAGAGGMPELVEDDCGFVVPYLDVAAFAERVLCLIDSPSLRTRMGAAARKKVQCHDISVAGPRILDIIERTIASRT